ncbi:MAG TPA: hypothetical protein VNT75_30445 [Symbiobacteriaceae bacterium]|nr:hypothetical protein [Symbiobacteriaceae bacterium]
MFAQPPAPRRLAVATLSEAGDEAAAFRGPEGRPLQGYVLMTGEGPDCQVTVYIERGPGQHTAVLAGEMVWFQSQQETAPPTGPVAQAAEPQPPADPAEEPAEVGFKLYPEPAVPVSAIVPHKIEVTVTPVPEPLPEPAAAVAPEPAPPEAPPQQAEAEAEAERPVVTLASRHPLAPRAGGTARIDAETGRLTLTVRGLPSPALLNRSANAYRAWLLSQRSGTRHDLGLLTRLWGENFRLESEPLQPLDRFDAIVVTAEDRAARGAVATAPQVLLGTYSQL